MSLKVSPALVRLQSKNDRVVQDCDVYIGGDWTEHPWNFKCSLWNNPFKAGDMANYEEYVRHEPKLWDALESLTGKVLGCWCKVDEDAACHGDVILKLWKEKFPDYTVDEALHKTCHFPEGKVVKRRTAKQVEAAKKCRKVFRSPAMETHKAGIRSGGTHIPWPQLRADEIGHTLWVDEAGNGSWAGPLTIGITYLKPGFDILHIHDSKLLKPHEREKVYDELVASDQIMYEVVNMTAAEIDADGIGVAWRKGICIGVSRLKKRVEASENVKLTRVVVDGNKFVPGCELEVVPVTKADQLFYGVAAASIYAKASRDRYMTSLAQDHPKFYNVFGDKHGYGSHGNHRTLIDSGHYTEEHRKTFDPLRTYLKKKNRVRFVTQRTLLNADGTKDEVSE